MGSAARPPRDSAVQSAVRAAVAPVLIALGLDLEDLEIHSAGRRRRVCVVVDRDGGIDLDGLAEVSRAVSDALDAGDAMGDAPYHLEVTSPGVDRPLILPRHWRRNIGRRVRVSLADGTQIEGRVQSADDDGVTMVVDAAGTAERDVRRMAWAEVSRGDVQVEFRRPDSPATGDDMDPGED
jgi:ribosome maturation factor RimP